jgi:hypothetical protein
MSLFTGNQPDPLNASAHILMQAALETTKAALLAAGTPNVDRLALMVVALTGFEGTNNHPWAGLRIDEEHYSASLLKIAAMYAAFDLRSSADQLATDNSLTTFPEIEAALKSTFDPEIATHTPSQITNSTSLRPEDKTRKPAYNQVLQLGAGPEFVVDFTQKQLNAFEDMIVQQHNPGATTTIHGLGYPLLNGKLADDGFFNGSTGVWLAGDYAGGVASATTWPPARIDSKNDGLVAQATTAVHLARLLTLLFDTPPRLVGPLSGAAMQDLMRRAGKWFHHGGTIPPTLIWPLDGRFIATHSKVGLGPLKIGGKSTFSEGLVVRDTQENRDFVVVWQNVHDTLGPNDTPFRRTFEPVATLIEAALSAFVPF